MQLAILPGYNVLVPPGKLVGGSFKSTPLCSRAGETGCVISWTSFREKNPPPPGAMFGYADRPDMTVGCVNPAAPGSRDWVRLDSYWFTRSDYAGPRRPDPLVERGVAADTLRAHRWPGLRQMHQRRPAAATCRSAPTMRPATSAPTVSAAKSAVLGMFLPGWGMHLADVPEAEGDLIRAVGAIGARSRTIARR